MAEIDITFCFQFAGLVLIITSLWVGIMRGRIFTLLEYIMFFPGVTALCLSAVHGNILEFLLQISGLLHPLRSILFSIAAIGIVYGLVESCVLLSTTSGWAKPVEIRKHWTSYHSLDWNQLSGFLRAAGEEVGWRCLLLPCLLDSFSNIPAFLISGIIWGLFHVPVMILLTYHTRPARPYLTIAIQSLACILAAFPHGWLAVKTGYSLWACSVMHWFWNIYNPTVLGSIYINTPGHYSGQMWLINGEGLAGCLVMLPVAGAVLLELQYGLV